jgi:hypothetical protein
MEVYMERRIPYYMPPKYLGVASERRERAMRPPALFYFNLRIKFLYKYENAEVSSIQ